MTIARIANAFVPNVRAAKPPGRALLWVCIQAGVIAMAMATAARTAAAAENPPAPVVDLQQVQVRAERYDARRDDTAARMVVAKDELLRFGDSSLADAIKRLPGVSVSSAAPGAAGAISLRGMGKGYTQLLVDGQAVPPGFDLGSLSPDMVERIEILRTATADMRAEAIAGTINIVLAKSARADSRELKLSLGQSDGQSTPGIHWSQSHRGEHRGYALNASWTRREFEVRETGVETGHDARGVQELHRDTDLRFNGFRDAMALAPGFDFTLDNGDTLNWRSALDASKLNRRGDIAWRTQAGQQLQHARYRQITGMEVAQLRTELEWGHPFGESAKFTGKLNLGGNRERSRFREQGYSVDGEHNLDDVTDGALRVRNIATHGKYAWSGGERHTLEAGWEGSQDRRRESRVQRLRGFDGAADSVSDLSFDARIRRIALYAQDEWTATPRWSLYLGARWERIETFSEGDRFAAIRHRAGVLSPVLQSRWKLSGSKDQIRLGLSRSYRAPELRLLIPRPYTSTNNRELNPDQIGNPALKPELATGLDLAYEKYWDDGAMFSLGGYARRIEAVVRTQTVRSGDRWVATPVNGGTATAWGIEFDSKFSLARWLGVPGFDVSFNLTRNWSRMDDLPGPDDRIDKQPRLISSVAADYRIDDAWTVGASYSYRSGGPVRSGPMQIDSESARRELDMYGLRRLSPKSKLRLSAGNVLRQPILTGSQYFDENGSQQIERRRPSHANLRASLEIAF
ncbi:TonB-dependent receptor plug domain-containing protein [Lysobacter sp. CA199]|uniref:TonB-dependent receptor plug domain-containing protein n=1 Tax=Lysobacter sp. CA199 TaxID=3455608 RepID=UPI003F8D19D6